MVETSHAAQQSGSHVPAGTSAPSSPAPSRARPSQRELVQGRPFDEQVQMLAPRRPVQRDLPHGRSEPAAPNEGARAGNPLQDALERLERDRADQAVAIPPLMGQAGDASDAMIAATQAVLGRALRWATSEGEEAIRRFQADWGDYGLGLAAHAGLIVWGMARGSSPIGRVLSFVWDACKGYYDNAQRDAEVAAAVADASYASRRAAVAQEDAIAQIMRQSNSWVSSIGRTKGALEAMFMRGGQYADAIADLRLAISEAGAGEATGQRVSHELQQATALSANYSLLKDRLARQVAGMRDAVGEIRAAGDAAVSRVMTAFLKHKTNHRLTFSGHVQPNDTTFEIHLAGGGEMSQEMRAHLYSLSWRDLQREHIHAELSLQNMATMPNGQVTFVQGPFGERRVRDDVAGLASLVHWMRRPDPRTATEREARRRELSGLARDMIWSMLENSPMQSLR